MTDDELAAQLAEMRVIWQQLGEALAWALVPIGEALARALVPIGQAIAHFWQSIVAWIQQQGILSHAYAYATPAMRRRAARQRAHMVMQARNRHIR